MTKDSFWILDSRDVRRTVTIYISDLFRETTGRGLAESEVSAFMEGLKRQRRADEADAFAKAWVWERIMAEQWRAASASRAAVYTRQIVPWLVGNTCLDIGVGNGMIAANISVETKMRVFATDLFYYGYDRDRFVVADSHLPFPDLTFDTVCLITVLHHCVRRETVMREAWRTCRRRLIIKESVFGITRQHSTGSREVTSLEESFLDLSIRDQLAYTQFVDWFVNRAIEDGIPVPFLFERPEIWSAELSKLGTLAAVDWLGIEEPVGALYHVLYVLDR